VKGGGGCLHLMEACLQTDTCSLSLIYGQVPNSQIWSLDFDMRVSEGGLVGFSCIVEGVPTAENFIMSHRVLAAAVRLLGASYMHYILAPGQPAPGELLAFMQQQGSRHSRSGSLIRNKQGQAGAGDSSLFSFTKSMAFMPRIVVNAQVRSEWLP